MVSNCCFFMCKDGRYFEGIGQSEVGLVTKSFTKREGESWNFAAGTN
jgi:hypothetical protein